MMRHAETEKEALLRAADLLEAEGWCQHESLDGEGRRCVSQALAEQIGLRLESDGIVWQRRAQLWREVVRVLIAELELELMETDGSISRVIDWNDAKDRTREEVVAFLRRVASKL
jgi:hypothetical protein